LDEIIVSSIPILLCFYLLFLVFGLLKQT
jgi:hypothetical protein